MISVGAFRDVLLATAQILAIARPRRKLLVLCILFTAIASFFQLTGLGMVIPILNGLVDPNRYLALLKSPPWSTYLQRLPWELDNTTLFGGIVFLALLCAYLENWFLYLGQSYSARLAMDTAHLLRVRIFSRYLGFAKRYYDHRSIGELSVAISTFVTAVAQYIHHISMCFVVACFSCAFVLLMLLISWRLTVFAMFLLPLTHFASKTLTRHLSEASQDEVDHTVHLSQHVQDVLQNITLTQLTGQEQRELQRLERTSAAIQRHGLISRNKRFLIPRIVDTINTTGIVVLACAAAFLFFKIEATSIGRLSAFFIALRRFTSHVEQFLSYWMQCIANVPSLKLVLKIFDDSDKSFINSGTKEFKGVSGQICFNDVTFGYGNDTLQLQNVSFTAVPGTMTAIVGATGSGKTTLVSLIPRFYDTLAGTIAIDGTDIRDFDLKSLRRHMAIVSQHPLVFSDTLRNNLTYGLEQHQAHDALVRDAVERAELGAFVAALPKGLDTYIGAQGVHLSGGELQRVAIARAILRDPDILILDEATSALDAETEASIQKALDYLVEDRVVFVIAHRLTTIRRANQIIVLEGGRIVEHGSSRELLALGGTFQRYCELQGISFG